MNPPPRLRSRHDAPSAISRATRRLDRADGGGAALEFAIVGPILLMMLFAILVYGGYFTMAHSLQQIANDSARAAVAGLNDDERRQLAANTLAAELKTYAFLDPASAQLAYADQNQVMTVDVAYDASTNPIWALRGIIPMPSPTIVKSASVQVGGG